MVLYSMREMSSPSRDGVRWTVNPPALPSRLPASCQVLTYLQMVFSGPKQAVEDHVAELRGLNWQAFSVRYEEEVEWKFAPDANGSKHEIAEVETMSEAAQLVEVGKREDFLRAVGVK